MIENEPRFAGDMRWLVCWKDADGNVYTGGRPHGVVAKAERTLQVGVPKSAGPSLWFEWQDVPEVDET